MSIVSFFFFLSSLFFIQLLYIYLYCDIYYEAIELHWMCNDTAFIRHKMPPVMNSEFQFDDWTLQHIPQRYDWPDRLISTWKFRFSGRKDHFAEIFIIFTSLLNWRYIKKCFARSTLAWTWNVNEMKNERFRSTIIDQLNEFCCDFDFSKIKTI